MDRRIESVIRSLRRVNLQGSLFGQTVAIRFGLTESDVEALEVLLETGSATAGRLSELMGLTTGAVTRVIERGRSAVRDDDVRCLLRPEPGELDIALLEDQLATLVGDDRRAKLPFDLVERIDAVLGEKPLIFEP